MDAGAPSRVRRKSDRDPVELLLVVAGIAAIAILVWLAWRQAHAWICGSSNFISNDVCDEWNVATPPDDVLPVPPGWDVRWERLDCGSGGCGTRMYVVSPPAPGEGGVAPYLAHAESLGWSVEGTDGRLDELVIHAEPTTHRVIRRWVPAGLISPDTVFIGLSLCGEGASCSP
jgi:hypothetical protein